MAKDQAVIGKKTSALAIIYKNKCLVDKSKSDAVQIYLTYQIDKAKTEGRDNDAKELIKELSKHNLI